MYYAIGAPGSRLTRVTWMLEELGQSYIITLHAQFSEEMRRYNPSGKGPVLLDGELAVMDSAGICAYLADAFPEAGLAPSPSQRAAYYRWLFFGAGPMETALSLSGCNFEPTPEQQVQLGYGTKERVLDTLASALKGHRYIAGNVFSAADVYVGSYIGWSMQFGTIDKRPEFVAYWDNLKDRPAHQRVEAQIAQMGPPPDPQSAA